MDLYQRSTSHLSKEQAGKVRELFLEFQGTYSKGPHDLRHTSVVQHTIDMGDDSPIHQPPRGLPFVKREEAFKAISEMREQGIIEPSASTWASPVVLVKKKDGSTRFCVDYRQLNTVTRKDSYPLRRIEDILDTLSGSTWFSTLDLASGYWQVDRKKTTFTGRKWAMAIPSHAVRLVQCTSNVWTPNGGHAGGDGVTSLSGRHHNSRELLRGGD